MNFFVKLSGDLPTGEKAFFRNFVAFFFALLMVLKDRKSFSELYLNAALSEKAIERKYPNTPRHPRQQYRMTELAKTWKEGYEKKNK